MSEKEEFKFDNKFEDENIRYFSLAENESALIFRTKGFQPILPIDDNATNVNMVFGEAISYLLSTQEFCNELYEIYVDLLDDRIENLEQKVKIEEELTVEPDEEIIDYNKIKMEDIHTQIKGIFKNDFHI